MIYNIVVNAVAREVLEVVYGAQEAQNGMGWAEGYMNLVLYGDDGRIAGSYQIWVQYALTVTVEVF